MLRNILVVLAMIGFSHTAHAKKIPTVAFNLGLMYDSEALTAGSNEDSSTDMLVNFNGGIFLFDNFLFGLAYFSQSVTSTSTDTVGGTTTSTSTSASMSAVGLHVGFWTQGGFVMGLSPLFAPSWKAAEDLEYTGSSGFALNVGWRYAWESFFFGPQLLYTNLTFDKVTAAGTETDLTDPLDYTLMTPMGVVTLGF